MRRGPAAAVRPCWPSTGCAAPYDDDGELAPADSLGRRAGAGPGRDPGRRRHRPRRPTTWWPWPSCCATRTCGSRRSRSRRPGWSAATRAWTWSPTCWTALEEPPLPVACGREDARPGGRGRRSGGPAAERRAGLPPPGHHRPAGRASRRRADRHGSPTADGLDGRGARPADQPGRPRRAVPGRYARLAGVHAMAGAVDVPAVDGVAEWNAAADPRPSRRCSPRRRRSRSCRRTRSRTGRRRRSTSRRRSHRPAAGMPKWWDLTTAAAFVDPAPRGDPRHLDRRRHRAAHAHRPGPHRRRHIPRRGRPEGVVCGRILGIVPHGTVRGNAPRQPLREGLSETAHRSTARRRRRRGAAGGR